MSRQSANMGVYHAGESVPFFRIPITPSSVRRRKLMEENCCVFEFINSTIIPFAIGDRIVDDYLGGTFYITEEQEPAVISDGGYKYRVQFNAPEFLWKNRIYCLTAYKAGVIRLTDSVFNFTDGLLNHVEEIVRNLYVFGFSVRFCIDGKTLYTYNPIANSFDESSALDLPCGPYDGVEKAEVITNKEYNGTDIYKAIHDLADAYSCEVWYDDDNNVLFFGRCKENGGNPISFNAADATKYINVASLSAQKNENEYANKIYVYGSTKNIPDTYRKELKLKADSFVTLNGVELVGNRTFNADPIATGSYNNLFVSFDAFPVTPGEKYTFLLSCGNDQTLACLIGCAYSTLNADYAQVLYRGNTTTPTEQTITIPTGVNYLFISSLKSVNPYFKRYNAVGFYDSNKPFSFEMIKGTGCAKRTKILSWNVESDYAYGNIGDVTPGDLVTIYHKPYEAISISYSLRNQNNVSVAKRTQKSVSSDKSTVCTYIVENNVTSLAIKTEEPSEHFSEKSEWVVEITHPATDVVLYFPDVYLSKSPFNTQWHMEVNESGEIVPASDQDNFYSCVFGPINVTPGQGTVIEWSQIWDEDFGVYFLINGKYVYSHSFSVYTTGNKFTIVPPTGATKMVFTAGVYSRFGPPSNPEFYVLSEREDVTIDGKFIHEGEDVSIDADAVLRKEINNNGDIIDSGSSEAYVVNKVHVEPNTIIDITFHPSETTAVTLHAVFYDANGSLLQIVDIGFVRNNGDKVSVNAPSNAASMALTGWGTYFWGVYSFTIEYWYSRFVFAINESPMPDWFEQGIQFRPTDESMNLLKVPSSYYDQSAGDVNSIRILGEPRLRLPLQNGEAVDYIPNEWVLPEKVESISEKIVEKVVFIEDVYPCCALRVSEVETQRGVMKEYELSDGSVVKYQGTRYSVKLMLITSDGDVEFPFNKDMLLSSAPLQLTFITPSEEMEYSDGEAHGDKINGYKLCGMSFGVEWDQTGQKFIIAWNNEYGAQLPNENLMPVVGDPVLLSGWNVKGMEQLGLIEIAERKLQSAAVDYLDAIEEEQFTFECNMMSDWAKRVGALPIGKNAAVCYGVGKTKVSRILGYEFKFDIPEDTPKYIIGETDVYSRLKRLEKELNIQNG